MAATTLEKIRIDMPLPMPRWVMSSAEPHDNRSTGGEDEDDEQNVGRCEVGDEVDVAAGVAKSWPQWNKNTSPDACMTASATVR